MAINQLADEREGGQYEESYIERWMHMELEGAIYNKEEREGRRKRKLYY